MQFDLSHPKNVRRFSTEEQARELCPDDTGSITYRPLFSPVWKVWLIARYHGLNLTGYGEIDDAERI